MTFQNLTPIPNTRVRGMIRKLKLEGLYPLIIMEDSSMKEEGRLRYDEIHQIAIIFLRDGKDTSSLTHELRHLWQLEKLTPEVCRMIYEQEQKTVGYDANILEVDAYDWEKKNYKK